MDPKPHLWPFSSKAGSWRTLFGLSVADIGVQPDNHGLAVKRERGGLVAVSAGNDIRLAGGGRRGLLEVNRDDELLAFDDSFHLSPR